MLKSLNKTQESLIFGAIALITRLSFSSRILHEWDSVQFALALDKFDLTLHQPHPPGLFVFYLFFGRILYFFGQDANTSLVLVSVIASGLAVALIFNLTTLWFNRSVGRVVALLMLTSPLVWFQGGVALSYMLEFFWTLLIVWGCVNLRLSGEKRAFYLTPLLLGLAGGIRPNTLFFLFPLWVYTMLVRYQIQKLKLGELLLTLGIMLVGILAWLIPLFYLSGGIRGYWEALQPWLEHHPKDGVGRSFHGVYLNLKMLVESLLYGVGFAVFPGVWYMWKSRKNLNVKLKRYNWQVQTLVVWLIPGLSYLTLVHIQRLGHTFTIMPAFIVIGGVLLYYASLEVRKPKLLLLSVFVGNILFFIFGPVSLDSVPTWSTINQYDRYVQERIAVIEKNFAPKETMVLTNGRNARIREFYLPEYSGSTRQFNLTDEEIVLPENIRNLVIFDPEVLAESTELREQKLPSTGKIRFLQWGDNQQLTLTRDSVTLTQ
ncbi:glycosyltransferase family 39 protein [Gloeocapsa sp. PCC 73106]|uniref:ArnT family glycosyltransferase n=1 Tax=Gloeocapsa sp. PCC 73106 TaxID=102232 RepID=UPI0002ABFAE4|nr:DUF2723 domain-containing protein [Gloeocapsa sp. PCC 73106]ELR99836.1 hypothetical protein GLO73106DRAFT_00036880 [Gloeocapsa sp. PCC 73106]